MLELSLIPGRLEAGCDEAGRGCLAGPVYAAAVILPKDYHNKQLNDSKMLNEKARNMLRIEVEREALAWSVASCSPQEIDEHNILNASILAMHRALDTLTIRPEFILVDGNRFKTYSTIPHQTFIKGDGRFLSIAAASVLAKTHRDECMERLHREFPEFDWKKNKGYPSPFHRSLLISNGPTPYHRRSFKLKSQLKLEL